MSNLENSAGTNNNEQGVIKQEEATALDNEQGTTEDNGTETIIEETTIEFTHGEHCIEDGVTCGAISLNGIGFQYSTSDSKNYEVDENTGEIALTEDGVSSIKNRDHLPPFTIDANYNDTFTASINVDTEYKDVVGKNNLVFPLDMKLYPVSRKPLKETRIGYIQNFSRDNCTVSYRFEDEQYYKFYPKKLKFIDDTRYEGSIVLTDEAVEKISNGDAISSMVIEAEATYENIQTKKVEINTSDSKDTVDTINVTLDKNNISKDCIVVTANTKAHDGGEVTYTISDDKYYKIDEVTGAVTLKQKGVNKLKSENKLPSFTITSTSTTKSTSTIKVSYNQVILGLDIVGEFIDKTVDTKRVIANSDAGFIGSSSSEITYSLSDTTHYSLNTTTGDISLTQIGADVFNNDGDLPDYTITAKSDERLIVTKKGVAAIVKDNSEYVEKMKAGVLYPKTVGNTTIFYCSANTRFADRFNNRYRGSILNLFLISKDDAKDYHMLAEKKFALEIGEELIPMEIKQSMDEVSFYIQPKGYEKPMLCIVKATHEEIAKFTGAYIPKPYHHYKNIESSAFLCGEYSTVQEAIHHTQKYSIISGFKDIEVIQKIQNGLYTCDSKKSIITSIENIQRYLKNTDYVINYDPTKKRLEVSHPQKEDDQILVQGALFDELVTEGFNPKELDEVLISIGIANRSKGKENFSFDTDTETKYPDEEETNLSNYMEFDSKEEEENCKEGLEMLIANIDVNMNNIRYQLTPTTQPDTQYYYNVIADDDNESIEFIHALSKELAPEHYVSYSHIKFQNMLDKKRGNEIISHCIDSGSINAKSSLSTALLNTTQDIQINKSLSKTITYPNVFVGSMGSYEKFSLLNPRVITIKFNTLKVTTNNINWEKLIKSVERKLAKGYRFFDNQKIAQFQKKLLFQYSEDGLYILIALSLQDYLYNNSNIELTPMNRKQILQKLNLDTDDKIEIQQKRLSKAINKYTKIKATASGYYYVPQAYFDTSLDTHIDKLDLDTLLK